MKLSEAIRLGALLGPQGFGQYESICGPESVARCALGGAYAAAGLSYVDHESRLYKVTQLNSVNPATGDPSTIGGAIIRLNDEHRWSRERIADWVATVEPAEMAEDEEEVPEADAVLVVA